MPKPVTYSPTALTDNPFSPPDAQHWFGTDANGRDILSRIFYGARISLLVGVVGAAVSLVIGVLWGATAGYFGGRLDERMMRFVDILYALPSIVFVIVIITTLEVYFKTWLADVFSPEVAARGRMLFLFVGLGAVSVADDGAYRAWAGAYASQTSICRCQPVAAGQGRAEFFFGTFCRT